MNVGALALPRRTGRGGYGRWALPLVLLAVLASSSECDVGCELPDPKGPDGWRTSISRDR